MHKRTHNMEVLVGKFQPWNKSPHSNASTYLEAILKIPGQFSRYSDSLKVGGLGIEFRLRKRFSAHVQVGPGAHPACSTMVPGLVPGGKADEARRWQPTPHSAKLKERMEENVKFLKERVQLYLYTPSGPSSNVTGCTLSCTLNIIYRILF